MSLPFPFEHDNSPSSGRETPVEWGALVTGLALGLVMGLSTVYAHARAPRMSETKIEAPVVAPSAPEPVPAEEKHVSSVESFRSAIPARWIADESGTPRPTGKGIAIPRKRGMTAISGNRTLAYWNSLNDVIAKEGEMRTPPANLNAANAGAFLTSRTSAAKYAAGAITALDGRGVDPELLAHAKELTNWYRDEQKLSERGSFLLEKADVKTRKGAGGNQWKSGEEQHRQKCTELNQRGGLLRGKLAKKFKLEFPPLL